MSKTETPTCKLCAIRPASEIKSHIFTQSFLRSMLNKPGDNRRGVGMSFGITGAGGITSHVEQNAPHSHFVETFGEDITDEQIMAVQMDRYSKDYLLCSICEARIKVVEDYFNDAVYRNVATTTASQAVSGVDIAKPTGNNLLIRLFFYSLMWRASVARHDEFKFPTSIETGLRELLNSTLGDNLKETLANSEAARDNITLYPLIVGTVSSFSSPGTNMVFIEDCTQPYYFEINEYLIWFFVDHNDLTIRCDLKKQDNYVKAEFLNYNEIHGEFKVVLFTEQDWLQKINIPHEKKAKEFVESTKHSYIDSFKRAKGEMPTENDYQRFMAEILDEQVPMGVRWDINRINEVIAKHTR